MYIKLDPSNRLVYDFQINAWVIYTCKRIGPFTQKKYDAIKKANRAVTILRNNQGERAIGSWKRGRSLYNSSAVKGALLEWIYSCLGKKYKGKELHGSDVVELLDEIKTTISNVILMTNVLDVKITFDEIPASAVERAKIQQQTLKKQSVKYTKRALKMIGPDTVFAPTVVDNSRGEIYVHDFKAIGDGEYEIIRRKKILPTLAQPAILDVMDGKVEIINMHDQSLSAGKKGRGGSMFQLHLNEDGDEVVLCRGRLIPKKKATKKKKEVANASDQPRRSRVAASKKISGGFLNLK